MLQFKALSLCNIAVFTSLDLLLHGGLTTVVGEAGSGKSLILDALDWVLGANAPSQEVIRHGEKQARVELTLSVGTANTDVIGWCRHQAVLDEEELQQQWLELVISREWTSTQSRFRVNGILVSRSAISELRPSLLDLQSQHATVALFQPAVQMASLDALGNKAFQELRQRLKAAYTHWQTLRQQLETQEQNESQRQRELASLEEDAERLLAACLEAADEDELCRQQLKRLSMVDALQQGSDEALALLEGGSDTYAENTGLSALLSQLKKALGRLAGQDASLQPLLEKVEGLEAELKEAGSELRTYQESLESDPETLNWLTERLDTLEKLKRRYGPTLYEVIAYRDALDERMLTLQKQMEQQQYLTESYAKAEEELKQVTRAVSEERKKLASALENKVQAALAELAMPHAQFAILLESSERWSPTMGADAITLAWSANPGEPLKPLAKVASGGELARVLLAIKVATYAEARHDHLPVFVFDEIDTGTSGEAAKAIAQQLRKLAAEGNQVFTVTHQPLVAAYGTHCLRVEKTVRTSPDGEAETHAEASYCDSLDKRLDALSWLASGYQSSDQATRQFAQKLLDEATFREIVHL